MNDRAFKRAKETAQKEALEYGLDIDEEEIDELCKAAVEECLDYQINENATVEIYKDGTCLVYGE